jgi:hypothetical protein
MQQNLNQPMDMESEENFAALFEASLKEGNKGGLFKEGEVIKGTVVRVTAEFAIVDVGYKSEGQVAISEFTSPKGEVTVKPGDAIDVFLESRENETGMVVLSKEKADKMRIWDEISAAVKGDEIIKGTITGRVKGGLQGHRREGLPPRFAGRHPPGAEPGPVPGQGVRVQGHQVQPEARQHRAQPPRAAREAARGAEARDP